MGHDFARYRDKGEVFPEAFLVMAFSYVAYNLGIEQSELRSRLVEKLELERINIANFNMNDVIGSENDRLLVVDYLKRFIGEIEKMGCVEHEWFNSIYKILFYDTKRPFFNADYSGEIAKERLRRLISILE